MSDFISRERFIKICGVTSLADADLVVDAGADALGMIFAESPRQVTLDTAQRIALATRRSVVRVGVFRGIGDDEVLRVTEQVDLDAVQMHDRLSRELMVELHRGGLRVIKVLAIGSSDLVGFDDGQVDAVLVDGPIPGSGREHPWSQLFERTWRRPVIVAGGLSPENIEATLSTTNAWGCDVDSGVERSPGVKDAELVRRFVRAAERGFNQRKEQNG